MTVTVLSSPTQEVRIGPDLPFVMIGERINPTGRKMLASEMAAGDFSRVIKDALAQVAAGAHMLDVNAGIPLADEPAILAQTIKMVQNTVDVPLSIDSSIVKALESGLAAYKGKALVNSVTCEEDRIEAVLPIVKEHGAAIVCLTNGEEGIPVDWKERLEFTKRLVEIVHVKWEIPLEDMVIDPLAMPVGAEPHSCTNLFKVIEAIRSEFDLNMTLGASNTSFGMPGRHTLNAAFLAMAAGFGLTSAIMDARSTECVAAVRGSDVLLAKDEYGMGWIGHYRAPKPAAV